MSENAPYRALVCITTCNRVSYLRRYAPHFARFCQDDERFSLLVSLDGDDRPTIDFCAEWDLPLVYSDEREGVGLSKNRVLERFPDFDYYFFLDDDVELIDGSVFPAHVELARASNIHHFSLFKRGTVRQPTGESVVAQHHIRHGLFGGGQFNFYTGEGLRQVGGWHPLFAQYRRWGHTEHSYRFFRAGLAPAPFNVSEELSRTCIWHYPPTTSRVEGVTVDADQIAQPERALIDEALVHVPVQTIAAHHLTSRPDAPPRRLAGVLDAGERYPLVDARERRECRAAFQLWKFETAANFPRRAVALGRSAMLWPGNPMLRDSVKGLLRR
jgi:hypothetical protein